MNVLVVGSGGREHALCWSLAASSLVDGLFAAPGNPGIAALAQCSPIDAMDFDGLLRLCGQEAIDFVVVGPEAPLVAGLVDTLEAAGIKAFGPNRAAAVLEASKGFVKDLCAEYDIPTAHYGRFREAAAARDYIAAHGAPIVVKADGLAAGKGVTVAASVEEACRTADEALSGRFGGAGREIVIEEFLEGEEASFFALVDGENALALASAQDHKTVGEGDTGPNTGGMGAYSPAPLMTPAREAEAMERIIRPTIAGMAAKGRPYKGILYAGLMVTQAGLMLLEYNVRFGDPECQVLMPRLMSDLLPALLAARDGVLDQVDLRWYERAALCVVMAARGYPGEVEPGSEIRDLEAAAALDDVLVFHAGTAARGGRTTAAGGRVLGVTATGATIAEAQAQAYRAVDAIDWPEGFCRRDIGWRAVSGPR